jgi:uncharacterized membrane protein YbhN (UPF0104 family)
MDRRAETSLSPRALLPGFLVSATAVAVLVGVAEPARAIEALLTARPIGLAAGVVVFAVALACRAAASCELVDGRVGFWTSFGALNIGYLANNLLPLRVGEVARSVVLGRRSGLGVIGGGAAVAAERLLDLVMAAALLVAALPAAGVDAGWVPAAIAGAAAIAGIAVLVFVARRRGRLEGWLEPRLEQRPKMAAMLPRLTAALDGLAKPGRLLKAALWLGASWALAVVFFWCVLAAFVPSPPLSWAAFGLGVMAFGIALPSSPGAVGIFEAAWVGALALCGVGSSAALACAVAAHALSFSITSGCGLVALVRETPGGGGVFRRARALLASGEVSAGEEAAQ